MTDVLRLDDQLCFALHAASRAMTGAYQPLLEELGVTYPQYLVLMALWEEDGARVSRLGERLYLDSATLTPLLKRLESRALVERRRSRVDERVVEVFLTPEGKRLEQRALELFPQLVCKTRLSLGEIVRLRDTLRKLTRTLHEATGEE
ncbi:Organic hydroperoxide resistance transcriptional regulator [Cystobacter fuscus]|uniref:Organic hydroperoxide resistance transcriptional regulator n=1 Tax=Cystobacter fuscus TaxID=43 RepID=A0A250JC18_9BACT|nr:MarR family transcriptional regulator [Cystobacter fuscus]ATB41067.1 Organic hydroperoxide resistance transcriptional regulator [Cystobacter fuscus]